MAAGETGGGAGLGPTAGAARRADGRRAAQPDVCPRGNRGRITACPFWIDVAESLKRDQVYVSAGQYTVTPDDKPIIGPHPEIEGLFFNTGYSGHGIMGAPGGGRLLADLVAGRADDETNSFSFRRLAALEAAGAGHKRLL